jgi:hypothetical protein
MGTTLKPEDEKKLGEFIARWPLYSPIEITPLWETESPHLDPLQALIPGKLEADCPKCRKVTWHSRRSNNAMRQGGLEAVVYCCRNCEDAQVIAWVLWGVRKNVVTFEKCGQRPKLEIHPAKSLETALGEKASLYRKGLICRHQGYGLAAVAYLRRVVEDTIDEMIDALLQAMRETGSDEGAIAEVEAAKKSRAVEDKVQAVANLVPNHLRPGGINPFGLLYGLLSAGLHDLTEEECLEIADGIIKVFDHVFVEMSAHVGQRKNFTTGMQSLQAKYAAKKKPAKP